MSKKEYYIKLPRPVMHMTAEELLDYFPQDGETQKSVLMRSLIMNEREYMRKGGEPRSLRSLWYSTIKPTLSKLGLLEASDQTEESLDNWDKVLSRYVVDLLKHGCLTYGDLNIQDTSRQKQNPARLFSDVDINTFCYQVATNPYPNIIIATEKDTVYHIISRMARLFGTSCISCKGQNSMGAMEYLIRGIIQSRVIEKYGSTIKILSMTDYDPAGYYIAAALEQQARDILDALDYSHVNIEIVRVGITPDQLDPDLVAQNKYTPKPANIEKWLEATGGIDGEPYGLELDALEPRQIREIFVSELLNHIDTGVYQEFVKKSYIRKKALQGIVGFLSWHIENIIHEVEDGIVVNDINLYGLAIEGRSTIPIDDICTDNMNSYIYYLMDKAIKEDFLKEYDETLEGK